MGVSLEARQGLEEWEARKCTMPLVWSTRPNSHVICAQTYTIKLFEFFTFYVVLDFYSHKIKTKQKKKIKCKNNQNNAYKEVRDAQIHDNEAFNTWRVLQRSKELDQGSKELDQGSKEQKFNQRNPSSSKRNDCLEWVSQEKWDEGWKNENQRCT